MHHKGFLFNDNNIQQLLDQRYINAQIRKQGGRHKGPPPFTRQDRQHFEHQFKLLIQQ